MLSAHLGSKRRPVSCAEPGPRAAGDRETESRRARHPRADLLQGIQDCRARDRGCVDLRTRPARGAGRFPLTGRGSVITYALFAELFTTLTSPRGRPGVIVPTGIATDATTAPFSASLVQEKRLSTI
jgi:hypothetical protein